jgi:mutator protein MutT
VSTPSDRAPIEVAAALIQDEAGRYLITRRREGTHLAGLWEFPGGKCEEGETLEACLRRELHEELEGAFEVGQQVDTVRWQYPEKTVVIHFFRCRLGAGTVAPRESQAIVWVPPERLADYEFPPADAELIARLRPSPPDSPGRRPDS